MTTIFTVDDAQNDVICLLTESVFGTENSTNGRGKHSDEMVNR